MDIKNNELICARASDMRNGTSVIPDSVTSIGSCAFRNCSSLAEITIPDSVTSIGNYAFNNCSSLTEISYWALGNRKSIKVSCIDGYIMVKSGNPVKEYEDIRINRMSYLKGYENGDFVLVPAFVAEKDRVTAHGGTAKEAVIDLKFKLADSRGAEIYKNINLDQQYSEEDMSAIYHSVTRSCSRGIREFISDLGENAKDTYSVNDVLKLTKEKDAHGWAEFADFFK